VIFSHDINELIKHLTCKIF